MVQVYLTNHGNVDVSTLPMPAGTKRLYSFPTTTSYLTGEPAKDRRGAEETPHLAGMGAVRRSGGYPVLPEERGPDLGDVCRRACAGNKTVIQLGSELLSAELPAPAGWITASYADTTKVLALDVDMTSEQLAAFYRDALGKAGWTPTTERPAKIDFREMLLFRNAAKEILTLKMHPIDGKLRANLDHLTAAEFAEKIRLAEAEEVHRKTDSVRYLKMAAEEAAR